AIVFHASRRSRRSTLHRLSRNANRGLFRPKIRWFPSYSKRRSPAVFTIWPALSSARNKSLRLFELASIRTIFVFGAIACAHCTSSAISSAQPLLKRGGVETPQVDALQNTTVTLGCKSPKCDENCLRSDTALGL